MPKVQDCSVQVPLKAASLASHSQESSEALRLLAQLTRHLARRAAGAIFAATTDLKPAGHPTPIPHPLAHSPQIRRHLAACGRIAPAASIVASGQPQKLEAEHD